MGRPKASADQQIMAYRLYSNRGFGPTAIMIHLDKEFDYPVHKRTVEKWVAYWKNMPEEIMKLDVPFEWHQLEDYGLSWDSGAYLLAIWRMSVIINSAIPITARHMQWCWRIHLADSKLGLYDVWAIAHHFETREIAHRVLGESPHYRDLEAWLAYKPWKGNKHRTEYDEAIKQGFITALRDLRITFDLTNKITKRIDDISGRMIPVPRDKKIDMMTLNFPNQVFPDLPSTIFEIAPNDKIEDAHHEGTHSKEEEE